MQGVSDQVVFFITTYGIKVVGAIVILIIGRLAAGLGRSILKNTLEKRNVDPSIVSFASSLAYVLILTFTVLAALAKFGIQTASFVAVLGAASFAIGFALKGSLGNFASGVLILVLRPYRVGDVIECAGVVGAVREIQLFTTVLSTPDNIKIMVPNGKIYGEVIKNISAYDTRRVDLVMGIGYDSDIQKAMDIMTEIMKSDDRILADPAPLIAVSELADSSVNLVVRPWVKKEDYWGVKFALTRRFKEAFDKNGIDIPYPQHVVHMAGNDS